MKLEDWHTHSERCHHATGTIEDYVKRAIELGLNTIGISDHFPYEFLKKIDRIPFGEYAMTLNEIEDYLKTIDGLKQKYGNNINIRTAFEIDFFENQEVALNEQLINFKPRLDYILGSIHILDFGDGRGSWGFDDGRFLKDYEFYGANNVYMKYFETELKMVNSKSFDFDVICHFDLPKKFKHIPTNKEEVDNKATRVLEAVKKRGVAMEINTSGFRKDVGIQYPSENYIQKMHELDIPILLGSDAHSPEEIAWEFNKMIKIIKKIGYNQLAHYDKRKRTFIDI